MLSKKSTEMFIFKKYFEVLSTYHSQRKKGSRPGNTPKRDPYHTHSLKVMFPIHLLFFVTRHGIKKYISLTAKSPK